ncbi:MAG: LysR substrate-binding domain-containing protein [Vicinamibacterales bacterium]
MNNEERLELRHLRYFRVVAEELHFGRAATRLAVSQPSLSVQIRHLEDIVGATLLERHTRHVELTDAGHALMDASTRVLRDVAEAVEQTRRAAAGEVGVLRIGFGPTLMLSNLAQVIRSYRHRHPRVRLELRELAAAEQQDALVRGDLDIGFVRGPEAHPGLHVELFAREPLVIAVSRDHPKARARRLPLSALAEEPWVLFPRVIAPEFHDQVLRLCRDAGFTPRVVQESREVHTTVGLVGAGIGVTIVPDTVRRMAGADVVYHPVPRAWVRLSIVRPSGTPRAVVQTFLDVVARR